MGEPEVLAAVKALAKQPGYVMATMWRAFGLRRYCVHALCLPADLFLQRKLVSL